MVTRQDFVAAVVAEFDTQPGRVWSDGWEADPHTVAEIAGEVAVRLKLVTEFPGKEASHG